MPSVISGSPIQTPTMLRFLNCWPAMVTVCAMCSSSGDREQAIVRGLQLRVAQEDDVRVLLRERRGLAPQVQPDFLGQPIGLAPVALLAGDHDVLPAVGGAAPGDRLDVVYGELGGCPHVTAVLAGVVVTEQEV